MKRLLVVFFSIFFVFSLAAQDTFSICAIDTVTGEVGSAGASCVYISGQGVRILSDVHPGVGVIHTQAWYRPQNQAYARQLMNDGIPPEQIIDSLVANDSQGDPTKRQYGIVDFREGMVSSAAFTGENCDDYKSHIIGPNYTIQGNILLGQEILDSMEARFLSAEGELACRLMEALQGAKVVGADTRCLPDGISSIGSFLRVAQPEDDPAELYLDFNIPIAEEGVDPIDSLQTLMDDWGGCTSIGIGENKTQPRFHVYPNPGDKFVYFKSNSSLQESYEIRVFNTSGIEVFHAEDVGSQQFTWNTAEQSSGVYLYRLLTKSGETTSGKILLK